jgi:hypothetical protein
VARKLKYIEIFLYIGNMYFCNGSWVVGLAIYKKHRKFHDTEIGPLMFSAIQKSRSGVANYRNSSQIKKLYIRNFYFYKVWGRDFIENARSPHCILSQFLDRGFLSWRVQNWASDVSWPTNNTDSSTIYKIPGGV